MKLNEMTDQEINEAVAKKLGSMPVLPDIKLEDGIFIRHWADYCHSINLAWEIVERCSKSGFKLERRPAPTDPLDIEWCCWFGFYGIESEAIDKRAPMAICKAFLNMEDQ